MISLPLGAGGIPSPFFVEFFESGRALKIVTVGAPAMNLGSFNPLVQTTSQGHSFGIAATDDHVSNPEFIKFTYRVSGGQPLGTVTCRSYHAFAAWSAAVQAAHPGVLGFMLNSTAVQPDQFGIMFFELRDTIELCETLGLDGHQLRAQLGLA